MIENNKTGCMKCIHFAVTWEAQAPKGCKLFGFKSKYMPSSIVFKSTGAECLGFEEKSREKNGDG